jgi:hypothetical protein
MENPYLMTRNFYKSKSAATDIPKPVSLPYLVEIAPKAPNFDRQPWITPRSPLNFLELLRIEALKERVYKLSDS